MEINTKAFTFIPMLVLLSLIYCHKSINGFTLDLIHRDSPLSPFHNPSHTPYERLQNAFHRSFSRASFIEKKRVNSLIQSTVTPDRGEFLMKISIGSPSIDTLVIADTGSDLTWTQCEPCIDCYKQLTPIFNPKNSASYKTIGCNDTLCHEIWPRYCNKKKTCSYIMSYGDQSQTKGELSIETFTFASTSGVNVSIPNIVFGCGHDNEGTFTNATTGIVGLGGGNFSIVNQMHREVKGKFSYCLIPLETSSINPNATSHINFGDSAVVSGPGVVSTPLIRKEQSPFYYLNLKSVSVGNKTFEFNVLPVSPPVGGYEQGNIIIDSGTTLMLVPDRFYLNFETYLIRTINATKKDDPSGNFRLCYESNENGTIDVPKIVAHFTNADLELSPSSTFVEVVKGLVCLTIVPGYQLAIFGNLAQSNFLIGYDLVDNKVSFKPTDCTKY